ncbi:MAG: D-2-hydroxyacid dehydrogenase [Firmicutes bacterium]|jgi:phosphoglycerate dehydrogenase-like enzyme|nr:D-2-hydroxyacid dehydrogenase [Bacillota bacterium]
MELLAIVGPISTAWQDKIRNCRPDLEVLVYPSTKDLATTPDARVTILATGGGSATAKLIPLLPRLRWIQTWTAGIDGLIESVPDHIAVTTMKGLGEKAVAEHAIALLLSVTRIRPNSPTQERSRQVPLETLDGKTHLIVGYGHIGQRIGVLSQAFGMKVIAVRNHPMPNQFHFSDLPRLLPLADVITLASPLTPSTYHVIDGESLSRVSSHAILINIARAELVDQDALWEALVTNRLGGAGLDVTTPEPLPEGHPLLSLASVVVTPHVAGNFPDYFDRASALLMQNLINDYQGHPLENVVRISDGY